MATEVNFEVSELRRNGAPVLVVRGEVDVATAPQLRERLFAFAEGDAVTVIVDLTDVSFVDSTALGVLVSSAKRLRQGGGDLKLVVTEPHISKVLTITGLTEVFEIYADAGAALSA
jgi:anti-sigma B factor antagonist